MPTQSITIPIAQLYLGFYEQTSKKACSYLQSIFCSANGCNQCITCVQIYEKRYASCLWLAPKKQYILEDLVPLQEKIQFSLGEHERFFFIIEAAECLSLLSSNALLKSLEEPPLGYYFMLLAKEPTVLLPTIVSRCVIFYTQDNVSAVQFKPLYDHFTQYALVPSLFLQELERSKITEEQSEELLKQIMQFWQKKYTETLLLATKNTEDIIAIEKKLTYVYQATELLPNSGNAKLFWKKLLLQFDLLVNA